MRLTTTHFTVRNMNRFIHPRNPYKKRPDFEALAAQFPNELEEAFRDGKFDFSKRENTIALSKCLLKKDFDLDIDFPPRSLAPSLTLKINYILWIQDILQAQIKKCERLDRLLITNANTYYVCTT